MNYLDRWDIIDNLGEGGQGKVYLVIDKTKFDKDKQIRPAIQKAIVTMCAATTEENLKREFELFRKSVIDLIRMGDSSNQCALKVLHTRQHARDADSAETRIKGEIQAMSSISHPNLLKILDFDQDSKWFVSQFYPGGTLTKNLNKFAGDFPKALRAFRSLVEGVAELHKNKIVHRDIKPENVFFDSSDNLVLGDFGLVFFLDQQHSRVSDTWGNVGSHDWMPGWAMGMRIEDIKLSFDVFCLGKLLWTMVSGSPKLRLWYFDAPQFNLEKKFPDNPLIRLANPLLQKCIVEKEENCLTDATELLQEINKVIAIIDNNANRLDTTAERPCKVCGAGKYKLVVNRDMTGMENFGLRAVGTHSMKIFICTYCGNVQLFSFSGGQKMKSPRSKLRGIFF